MHDVHAGSMADLLCRIVQITIYCDFWLVFQRIALYLH